MQSLLCQANILVKDDLHCCLADFGLAVIAEEMGIDSASSSDGTQGGTTRWMPPEAFDDSPELSSNKPKPPRDIYSFGCTIIEVSLCPLA